jgi:glutaredoxin-like protein NrdH
MILVYSLPDCISCELTKRAFTRRAVEFQEIQLTDELIRMWKSKGYLSAPIVDTGDGCWYGLRPDLIQEAANVVKRAAMGGA